MNEGLKKFRELFLTDEDFRNKVNVSLESYDGEESVEAVFNNVFAPIAAEYGISASFDEFEEYISDLNSEEVSEDELAQIAGGTKGLGAYACRYIGLGYGGTDSNPDHSGGGSLCLSIGIGNGAAVCVTAGIGTIPIES